VHKVFKASLAQQDRQAQLVIRVQLVQQALKVFKALMAPLAQLDQQVTLVLQAQQAPQA
jgi:hypothetical protein